jgi:anaerobic ribonucleoside-triphosphate reductase activating protein
MEKGRVRLSVPKIQSDSIVDGEGIRSVIWFQGCSHNCPGCHNPETHDFKAGYEFDIEEVKEWIRELEFQQGVTFSGGDPMMQVEALIELAKEVHECNMNVWVYTGFTYEEIMKMSESNPKYMEVLKEIDILVDGKFVLAKKSFDVAFRGSSNQRIILVQESLKAGKVILSPLNN